VNLIKLFAYVGDQLHYYMGPHRSEPDKTVPSKQPAIQNHFYRHSRVIIKSLKGAIRRVLLKRHHNQAKKPTTSWLLPACYQGFAWLKIILFAKYPNTF